MYISQLVPSIDVWCINRSIKDDLNIQRWIWIRQPILHPELCSFPSPVRHLVHKLPPEVSHPTATPLGVRQEGNTLAKRSGVGMPWSFRKQVAYQCILHHTRRCICVYWIQHICTLVVNSICKICQGLRDHVRNICLFQVGLPALSDISGLTPWR